MRLSKSRLETSLGSTVREYPSMRDVARISCTRRSELAIEVDIEELCAAGVPTAELVTAAVEETLACYAFPEEHWRRIRTNNRLNAFCARSGGAPHRRCLPRRAIGAKPYRLQMRGAITA